MAGDRCAFLLGFLRHWGIACCHPEVDFPFLLQMMRNIQSLHHETQRPWIEYAAINPWPRYQIREPCTFLHMLPGVNKLPFHPVFAGEQLLKNSSQGRITMYLILSTCTIGPSEAIVSYQMKVLMMIKSSATGGVISINYNLQIWLRH